MKPLILKGHQKPLTCVKYNYEGDLLFSAAKDNMPTVWYTSNGERLGTFDGHRGTVWSIDPDRTSTFCLTGGGDCFVIMWRVQTGEKVFSFVLPGSVRCVEWAEGDQLFLAVSDPFRSANAPSLVSIFSMDRKDKGKEDGVGSVKVSPQPVYQWSVEELGLDHKLVVATWGPLNAYILTGDDRGTIRVHDPFKGTVLKTIDVHTKRINSLNWNKDKTLVLTGSSDQSALLIDPDDWSVLKRYESNTPVNSAVISPLKEHVLVAGGQEAMNVTTTSARVGKFETKFFHAVFCEEWGSVKGHFGPVNTLAIHPDGTGFTSGAEDGYIRIHTFDKDYFKMHAELDDLSALEELAVAH